MKGIQTKASKKATKKAAANKVTDITAKRGRGRPRKPAPDEQEPIEDFRREPLAANFEEDDTSGETSEQLPLPGTQVETNPDLEAKGRIAGRAKDAHTKAGRRKKEAENVLIACMIEGGITDYVKHGVEIHLVNKYQVEVTLDS